MLQYNIRYQAIAGCDNIDIPIMTPEIRSKTMVQNADFKRNRKFYALIMLIVIVLGLGSRMYANHLPLFIATYAGDTLWALQVFLATGFLFPSYSTIKVATIASAFAFFIEVTQLYHAPWLDDIRQYRLAGLILGYGFLWSDLLCYGVGITVAVVAERNLKK